MSKDLVVKVGQWTKNGETKNKWQKIGVLMESDNGQYLMLDPFIDLSGILLLQNQMSGDQRENVMVSIFDRETRQGSTMGSGAGDTNVSRPNTANQNPATHSAGNDFDRDIPF